MNVIAQERKIKREARAAAIQLLAIAESRPTGIICTNPKCRCKGKVAPGTTNDTVICPKCGTPINVTDGSPVLKMKKPTPLPTAPAEFVPMAVASSLAARVRLDRAARALARAGGIRYEAAVARLTARAS